MAAADALNSALPVFNFEWITGMSYTLSRAQLCLIKVEHARVEARKYDPFEMRVSFGGGSAFADCDLDSVLERETICAATDRRKRDRANAMLSGERKTCAITRREKVGLSMSAIPVHRADSVNHVACRETIATRNPCFASRATTERATFSKKLRPCGAMNRTVHTASAEQRRVSGIYDRIDIECDDVRLQRLQLVAHAARPSTR
jgi:hypothetical protein